MRHPVIVALLDAEAVMVAGELTVAPFDGDVTLTVTANDAVISARVATKMKLIRLTKLLLHAA